MADLDKNFDIKSRPGEVLSLAMAAEEIFRGGAVGIVLGTGYVTKYVYGTASMRFVGIATEHVDNSGGSAGDKRIRVMRKGVVEFNQSGLAVTDIGKPAYLSDDNTISTTVYGAAIGIIVGLEIGRAHV